ncbi:hypothetical protein DPEC_G00332060 [Dallia pectoralis]|uniref:Uncharacterized protein n=1 Tax=Dallia pectoralis TaxID=75939 RepID=A0ACC2F632_DALPE|nr:hypothetical protein DPEC_G00332060 [Dallia pectoralis]
MDVDVCAGGDSALSDPSCVLEIMPWELYDSARAKIDASLRWLLAKAYGIEHIPEDMHDVFYMDQYEQEHIKPPLIKLLLSGELYCRVCSLIQVCEQASSLQSHLSIIQALSRKGVYVLESDDNPVSDADLGCSPIKMSSHISLIDALMMAYTIEMMSVERVVASLKRFAPFSASQDLPFDLEDVMIFWINEVILKMREITEKEAKTQQHFLESQRHQKVRYRRDNLSGQLLKHFPVLGELMKDVCDGTALLAVVHFYCPGHMRLEDICLKKVPSIAESLYNIQLLREFSNEYLNRSFYLLPEDVLYAPPVLKQNIMVFIAELFWWFEIVKPNFVQPRDLQEVKQGQRKRSNSLSHVDGQFKASMLACPQRRPRPVFQSSPYTLHFSPEGEGESGSLARSISKDSLASNLISHTPKHITGVPEMEVPVPPRRGNGQGLHSHIRLEDKEANKEELVALIHPAALARRYIPCSAPESDDMEQDELEVQGSSVYSSLRSPCFVGTQFDRQAESFFLEPLMPAVLKPAKEKSVSLNKEEESGESRTEVGPKKTTKVPNCTFTAIPNVEPISDPFRLLSEEEAVCTQAPLIKSAPVTREHFCGFFLPLSLVPVDQEKAFSGLSPDQSLLPASNSTTWDKLCSEEEEEEEEEEQIEITKKILKRVMGKCQGERGEGKEKPEEDEGESTKLREDKKVCECEGKEGLEAQSDCSSPCLSTASWASSIGDSGSGSLPMTSFVERRLKQKVSSFHNSGSSTSSSQVTTPDDSESASYPQEGLGQAPSPCRLAADSAAGVGSDVLASSLVQLHMQLEERRRVIQRQKRKMETTSAHRRLELGKAAFLNIVKKGGGKCETLPQPLKHPVALTSDKVKQCRDDLYVDVLRGQTKEIEAKKQGDVEERLNRYGARRLDKMQVEPDLNECSRSIELLNEAIGTIQKQMMQLSLQQSRLRKQGTRSTHKYPPATSPLTQPSANASKSIHAPPQEISTHTINSKFCPPVHFVETISTAPAMRRPPKLSSGCSPRTKPFELTLTKAIGRPASKTDISTSIVPCPSTGGHTSSPEEQVNDRSRNQSPICVIFTESARSLAKGTLRRTTFKIKDEANQRSHPEGYALPTEQTPSEDSCSTSITQPCMDWAERLMGEERKGSRGSGKENEPGEEGCLEKGQVIMLDLSDPKEPAEEEGSDVGDTSADQEEKLGLGFFFKEEKKMAEDEMAKRRAQFLLKRQQKMEEARLRKLQTEAESEQKRVDVRRKTELDRVRKQEEKVRRELIKQEYLRRKQQELMDEQGLIQPRPRNKARKARPKSLHHGAFSSDTGFCKGSFTPNTLSCSQSGSTLSLVTEAVSVTSEGAKSQRCGSVELCPLLRRNSSRNMEKDWENGSTVSSLTAEYHGPKLFKECVSKSNKPIIHNAIAHCCLAGKVNEAQKNTILEELERCKANHFMILFRDGSCQFRAIYSFSPDTEEIVKFTGTGPRSISCKMIDKLYKYSSDRKQFNCIPAKTVSVSVDALTIHNHLWHIKRPGTSSSKK